MAAEGSHGVRARRVRFGFFGMLRRNELVSLNMACWRWNSADGAQDGLSWARRIGLLVETTRIRVPIVCIEHRHCEWFAPPLPPSVPPTGVMYGSLPTAVHEGEPSPTGLIPGQARVTRVAPPLPAPHSAAVPAPDHGAAEATMAASAHCLLQSAGRPTQQRNPAARAECWEAVASFRRL